ncbi:MAG: DEAD/DEAH box helicase [Candidatus Thorarchaeota archaeon]
MQGPLSTSVSNRSRASLHDDHSKRPRETPRVQSREEIEQVIAKSGIHLRQLPDTLRRIVLMGRDYLVHYRRIPPSDAEFGRRVGELQIPNRLKEYLTSRGIETLYRHQDEAFRAIEAGRDVVIVAPTAQGKTEAFMLPIIKSLLESRTSEFSSSVGAILIYPTKALARDQFDKIKTMCQASGLSADIFDGDVPSSHRDRIYENPPDILLTNPDVLHYHLGRTWSRLTPILDGTKFVVLDEIHLYTGSMGANVYYILKRLAIEIGHFQLIGASATVSNPKEFAEQLFDREVLLIQTDSAKRGAIHFLMYYPGDRSKYSMIADLAAALQRSGFKTLVFGNTHNEAELINILLQDKGIRSRIHRAGLPKRELREIEQQFKSGSLSLIVSTPTLELGIDIGDLDSVISMLVSVTRVTQRIGRAGRKGQEAVAILALRDKDPISSFYRSRPDRYFTDIDAAYVEPGNEVVGYYQLIAAAMSRKLKVDMFPHQQRILERLRNDGVISIGTNGEVRITDYRRAREELEGYNIRGIGPTVSISRDGRDIGERSMPMAAQELHPGAIYLHGGQNYRSVEFQYSDGQGKAVVVPHPDRSVYTRPLYYTTPLVIETHEGRRVLGLDVKYCTLEMTQNVVGYITKKTHTDQVIGKTFLDTPIEYSYLTRGFVFRAPAPSKAIDKFLRDYPGGTEVLSGDPLDLYGGTFHAVEHVLIESSGMLTGGGAHETGGVSMGDSGTIFVYDGAPGGTGASKLLYGRLEEAFSRMETILSTCECQTVDGCPLCTYSYQCGNNNRPLFKAGALEVTRMILDGVEMDLDLQSYREFEPLV